MSTDKPLNFVFPAGVERIRVEKGKEQKSDTVITFFSDTGGKLEEETIANGAASLLQIRLRDLLREDLGGTYSVSADYSNTLPSPGYGTSAISFGSSPENAEKLTAAVLTEVKRLASEGPTAEDAAKVREQEKRELETSLKQNGYWLGGLQTLITLQRNPSLLASSHERIDTITPERLKAAYQKYYPMNRYTVATLVPDPAAVAPAPAAPCNPAAAAEVVTWPPRHRAHGGGAPPALDWQRPRSGRGAWAAGARRQGPMVRAAALVFALQSPMPAASPRCQSSAQARKILRMIPAAL